MSISSTPTASEALVAVPEWFQDVLLGIMALAISVIAVGLVGFSMFMGTTDVRRATRVIMGCFIIFGASAIASGLERSFARSDAQPQLAPPLASNPTYVGPEATPYDPYAGASVPKQ